MIIFGGHDSPFGKIIAVVSSHRFEDIKMLYENVLTSAEQAKASSLCFSGIGTGLAFHLSFYGYTYNFTMDNWSTFFSSNELFQGIWEFRVM